ncbi:hypothetical protein J2T59_001190 [Methanosalsum natronophilum]|nr:hypothetical protein [Methanosalsum natronophilum]
MAIKLTVDTNEISIIKLKCKIKNALRSEKLNMNPIILFFQVQPKFASHN